MYGLTLLSGPVIEPVSFADAKLHTRIDWDEEDSLIESWITAAREYAEEHCSRKWITQQWRMTLADWPCEPDPDSGLYAIRLPFGPVSAIDAVKYYATSGTLTTLVADTDYQVWLDHSPALIAPAPTKTWPTTQTNKMQAVRVEFTAGYGSTAASVPARLREAIFLTLTYWSGNRGDGRDPTTMGLPAGAIRALDSVGPGGYG